MELFNYFKHFTSKFNVFFNFLNKQLKKVFKQQEFCKLGDGFQTLIQGMLFSTYDVNNGRESATMDCAVEEGASGGWWFNYCSPVLLTGKYLRPGEYEHRNEIYWFPLTGNEESLETVEMKLYEN